MAKTIKKITSALSAVILALVSLTGLISASAQDVVAIDAAHFPDKSFREVVLDNFDLDSSGTLSESEIAAVKSLNFVLYADEILDLKGIEYFTAIEQLYAGDLGIEKADFSALLNLQKLYVQGNNLTSLDVSKNTAHTDLVCSVNENLSSLTLSPSVTKLICNGCALSVLDLSMCTNLTQLNCAYNKLSSLNLSANTQLSDLTCCYNNIAALDLSANALLENKVTSYNIGNQTIDAAAAFLGKTLSAPVSLAADKVAASSLPNENDEEGYTGYNGETSAFEFTDYSIISAGIDYEYDVSCAGAQNLTVHMNLTKNFYKVSFSDSQGGNVLDYAYAVSGGNVDAPQFPQAPSGMVCPSWSAAARNITQDTEIYAVWAANHSYAAQSYSNYVFTEKCTVCGDVHSADFKAAFNSKKGDANYDASLDADGNGYINVRDHSILEKTFSYNLLALKAECKNLKPVQ